MSSPTTTLKVMNIVGVGPKNVRAIICQVIDQENYDVLFIDEGKKLKQRIAWQNDSWDFKETAVYAEGTGYQTFFDTLRGKPKKPPRRPGNKSSVRRYRR